MAGKEFKPGDEVTWGTSQGETHGTVERKVTKPTKVKNFTAKASPDHPEYLVTSDKTGAQAVHKPEELRKGTAKGARKAAGKTARKAPAKAAAKRAAKSGAKSAAKSRKRQ